MSRRENDQRFWEVLQFINRYYEKAGELMRELWKKQAEEYQASDDSEKSSQAGPTTAPFPLVPETPRTEDALLRVILEKFFRTVFQGQQAALAVVNQAANSGQISKSSCPVILGAMQQTYNGPALLQQLHQVFSGGPSWPRPSASPQPESSPPASGEQDFQHFHREIEARYREAATQAQTQTDVTSIQALMRLTLDVRFLHAASMEMHLSDRVTLSRDSLLIVRSEAYQAVRDNTVIALTEQVKTFQYDPRFFQANPFNIQPQPENRREVDEDELQRPRFGVRSF